MPALETGDKPQPSQAIAGEHERAVGLRDRVPTSRYRPVSLSSSLAAGSGGPPSTIAPAGTGNASICSSRCHGLTSTSQPRSALPDPSTIAMVADCPAILQTYTPSGTGPLSDRDAASLPLHERDQLTRLTRPEGAVSEPVLVSHRGVMAQQERSCWFCLIATAGDDRSCSYVNRPHTAGLVQSAANA